MRRSGSLVALAVMAMLAAHPAAAQVHVGTITRSGWTPSAVALYEAGNKLLVFDNATDTVYVYDATTLADLGSIPTTISEAASMVVDESLGKLYVGRWDTGAGTIDDAIAVIDLATSSVLRYLPASGFTQLVKDEALDVVYAAYNGGVSRIQAATDTVTPIAGIIGGNLFTGMAVNLVTHELFVSNWSQNDDVLYVVDGTSLAVTTVADMAGFGVGVNWLENKAVVAYCQSAGFEGVCIYDRDTGAVTRTNTGNDATAVVFSPGTNRMYSTSEVNSETTIVDGVTDSTQNFPMSPGYTSVAVRESTRHVFYAGNSSSAVVLDEATETVAVVPLPDTVTGTVSWSSIAIRQASGHVYFVNGSNVEVLQDTPRLTRPPVFFGRNESAFGVPGDVFVVDPLTLTVVETYGLARESEGLGVRPGGGRVYSRRETGTAFSSGSLAAYAGTGNSTDLGTFDAFGRDSITPVVSPDGNRLYVTNSTSNAVAAIDLSTDGLLANVSVGQTPWGAAITPDGARLYVANKGSGTVSVIETAGFTVTTTIPVGAAPWGVAIHPAGTRAYVANSGDGTVSVIDTVLEMAVATVAVGAAPHGLAVSPGGRALYVANSDAATLSVVDTATITVTDTVSLAGTPEGVAVQPDGARVFVANRDASLDAMHVVDASTLGVTPVPLPAATVPVAVTDMTARFAGRVTANGVPVAGALVTASQLGVTVASATTDAAGHYSVFDLDPGTYDLELTAAGYPPFARPAQTVGAGRTSVWIVSLTGDEPAPVADSLSPASAPADGVGFTLSVLGSSFSGSSAIRWNGSVRATTYVSATELRTFIPASDIASPGSAQVTVFTPEPGGGVSAPLQFTIASVPFQLSIDDASVVEGDAGQASAVFTVSLAPARNQTVTVDYSMAPASASDGTTTLADAAAISIPSSGAATPYPSTISVPPLGPISKVTATLSGFSHTWPADVDLLLVGPSGQKVMLMSDVGGSFAVADLALTFDDAGPALTMSALASGTYRPTDEQPGETLPVPAPAGPYGTALSAFIGTDAAGTWSLYVADDAPGYLGSISNGWSLTFTTAGGDYVPTSGTLTFLPGSTSQTVAVAVNGDTDVEPDETFFVNLSGAVNAEILDGQAVGTIINDDTIPPPVLDAVPGGAITVGGTTTLTGTGFTAGTVIKLFVNMGASIDDVSGASGFTPAAVTPTSLTWNVPATVPLGEGFGSIFVVNTDQGFTVSNTQYTHLFGDAEDNIPTITSVNGEALATTLDPGVPVAHSDTVITPGSIVTIGGSGFSVASGFGVSLFGADLDNPGAVKNYGPLFPLAGASATSFQIEIPPALPAGPANFRVTNFVGEDILSNSVSSVAVARPSITSVSVSGDTVTILGAGFSPLSVINLFNLQGSGVVNLGGLSGSTPNIPLTFVSDTELRFPRPTGAQSGPAFVEVLNPPYIPFSSSGNDAQGAFVFP